MCSLYNPTTSFKAGLMLNRLCFFATRTNMSGITKLFYQISHLSRIITFIKTHALFFPFSRLWSFYRNTFYSSSRHFAIMSISAVNRQANRHSKTFSKQTAFNAFFGPVRGIWAGFFPRQAGPLSWHHPSTAMTSQYLLTHHNLPTPLPKVSEKFQLVPTPEIVSAPYCWNKYLFHSMRSTGNRFAIRKISHPLLCDPALSVCRHQNDGYSDVWVSMARFFPIIRLKFCIDFLFFVFSSLNPFKGTIASDCIGYSGVIRIGSKSNYVEAFSIPSASNYPTIVPGDRFLANKLSYKNNDPKRGDLIVFLSPHNRRMNYIKRVVAIAGDTVEIKDGQVYVNDRKLPRQKLDPAVLDNIRIKIDGKPLEGDIFEETNGDAKYKIFLTKNLNDNTSHDLAKTTVPKYHCFVLGDNRNLTHDSRNFGPISLATIKGRADYLYYPAMDRSRFGKLK